MPRHGWEDLPTPRLISNHLLAGARYSTLHRLENLQRGFLCDKRWPAHCLFSGGQMLPRPDRSARRSLSSICITLLALP